MCGLVKRWSNNKDRVISEDEYGIYERFFNY
jgi:hypothetical protein